MSFSGFPEFNINEPTGFDDNSCSGGNLAFDEFDWELSNVAGPSQHYSRVNVRGDLNNYPDFPSPLSAPTSLYPSHGESHDKEYSSSFYQGMGMSSFSPQVATTPPPLPTHHHHTAHSPVPAYSHDFPVALTRSYAQPQVISNPDDLTFGFPTTAGSSSQPRVHPSPPREELWDQYPQSNLPHLGASPFHPITGATPPGIPLPPPVASSSGPKRTRQLTREGRRYDPVKPAMKKANSKGDSWNQTVIRFRAQLDTLFHGGQPSGRLEPEMALARIDKLAKEDLKRSPLQDTKAGEGKRSRDVEEYLKGILGAISPAPIPAGAESNEDDTTVAALSRLADELEAKLAVVNQQSALLRSGSTSRRGQRLGSEQTAKRTRKNGSEKTRRDSERHHLERISRLFRVSLRPWSKKDVLILAVVFLLYGPGVFPGDFIEVRPVVPGL